MFALIRASSCEEAACESNDVSREPSTCRNHHSECRDWAASGQCESNSAYMHVNCCQSCGMCHPTVWGDSPGVVALAGKCPDDHQNCRDCSDSNNGCLGWALSGECTNNPIFMIIECAYSCATCHMRDPKVRCMRGPAETPPVLAGGPEDGINELFKRAISERWDVYEPTILSREPWVVQYENFLSLDEVDALQAAYDGLEFSVSSNVGGMDDKGRFKKSMDQSRTSTNAWCDGACAHLDAVRRVQWRIGNLTGVDEAQSEYLQLLRYEPGQYYRRLTRDTLLLNPRQP